MPPLPIVSGDECVAALRQAGRVPVTVPRHATLKRGTLRSILRVAEISVEEFLAALA
jgi:predicted RNA binding protein YcfA (HicA-like mRNA interferase family)